MHALQIPFEHDGEVLALDYSCHVSSDGQRLMVLNLIDEASKFHVAKIVRRAKARHFQELGNCSGQELIACLEEYLRYLPTPSIIHWMTREFLLITTSSSSATKGRYTFDPALAKHTGKMEL